MGSKKLSELTLTELILLGTFLREISRKSQAQKVFNEILDRIEKIDLK